ncbi:hypothetical protein IU405_02135 [Polaribacter sp. BAL334]|uniref:hypothetical protein n=1 Tax=Polaribacter sp. BAL334 TaxID=1708178 RepID=UPI0018D255DB|nr:hypothetical protein [Polaribacter sp. BAL334]MBG7611037.1 hypothetical protein [Polaribacter sp. BAL334]
MKSNKEVLDEFGKKLINDCFDPSINHLIVLKQMEQVPLVYNDFSKLFKSLPEQDFLIMKRYLRENTEAVLFNFLKIFEENEQFKLYFEENEQKVNLVEISEMLKAEPIIENGWIERFSKFDQK